MATWTARASLALSVLALAACSSAPPAAVDAGSGNDAASTDDTGSTVDGGAVGDVTYYGQVRPILAQHCVGCHTAGGIGPIALDSYDAARTAAPLVANYTASRRMPPFLADNSGACQQFTTNDWLSDADIATLDTWNRTGRLEGDPSTPAPPARMVQHLSGPTVHTIDLGLDYAPNSAVTDDYRCFLVNAPADGYVTGYEVHPGNARIVHHVIVYAPIDAAASTEAQNLDAAEAGPGYTCFGGSGTNAMPVVLWAPGGGATTFPRGTGLQIDGTRPLIVQVHYNLRSFTAGDTDRTSVDMQIEASATPAYLLPLIDDTFSIPPRMASYSHTHQEALAPIFDYLSGTGISVLHVYGQFPHMHTMGRDLQVDLHRADGSSECQIHVPRWDFNWQLPYWYTHPVLLRATDSLSVTCNWDSSSRDTTTTWGEGTQDEMCLSFFYLSI
jgi:mono/diheme cytochrome c family protein